MKLIADEEGHGPEILKEINSSSLINACFFFIFKQGQKIAFARSGGVARLRRILSVNEKMQ